MAHLLFRKSQCCGALCGRAFQRGVSTSPLCCASEDYYIQQSKVPTLHFQASLPRLPVPKLEDSLRRYLAALRPVAVSDDQYETTVRLADEFGREGGQGQILQKQLVENNSRNKHTSYIAEPWYDMYLRSRDPLVLNYNPFLAFKEDPDMRDQALRAANFIRSAVRFDNALRAGKLEPDVFHLNPAKSDTQNFRNLIRFVPRRFAWYGAYLVKAFPLDMSQYPRLFNSTRLPRRGRDEFYTAPGEAISPQFIVVMRNNHYYKMDVAEKDGTPLSVETLCQRLDGILSQEATPSATPIGYLTGIDRDKWAELRLKLDEKNRSSMKSIDDAMFVLCLDDQEVTTSTDLSHLMLHNYGSNRYYDKSFSLIVAKKGMAAINFEHAWGDGVAVLRFFNEIYKDTKEQVTHRQPTMEGVAPLTFELSSELQLAVEEAKKMVEEQCQSLSVNTMQYMKHGKNEIKRFKLSPDGVMQVAFQLAYYRLCKTCVPTYESCSTAAFKHGRTETIRSASVASRSCAEVFHPDHPAGVEEMTAKLKAAVDHHSTLVKEAAMGQGFDRHLFGLKTLAETQGQSVPLFEDPAYRHLNHIILSTSTLSADSVLIGGFAPVTPDGYGVGYGVQDDWLGSQVSTYPTRDGSEFNHHLEKVLGDVFAVLHGNNFK